MTVKHQHPEYKAMSDVWQRCRDASIGQRAIHAAGVVYLPRLSEQNDEEYRAYKMRTTFYNATWRTIDGLRGMLFRKPSEVKANDRIKKMLDDVTMTGQNLHMFSMDVTQQALEVGRGGIFIDHPAVPPNATMADVIRMKLRPSMRLYKAESIINWKTSVIDGVCKLSMVVLAECAPVATDEFEESFTDQYRVLDLEPVVGVDGVVKHVYRVRVMVYDEKTKTDITLNTSYPIIDGKPISDIPFQFFGVDSLSWEVDEPPLVDLVDVNLAHYRTNADYEHGCHFTGLPTPVVTGFQNEGDADKSFNIGSTTAWVFSRPEAKAFYLEFTGQGLQALEKNLARKENQMAVLGARMLEAQRSTTESANTATIRQGGEQSMLASIANTLSIALTNALVWLARFAKAPEDVSVKLNKDFFPFPMDSLMMTAYVAAWQNSAISYETMYENLRRGEVVPFERSPEEERKLIEANPPPLPAGKASGGMDGAAQPNLAIGGKADNKTATELQAGKTA